MRNEDLRRPGGTLWLRGRLLALACAAALTASAQQKECWLDPQTNRINTEKPRSDFFAFENTELAQKNDKTNSRRYLSLEGLWKFIFLKNHQDRPKDF